MSTPFPRIYYKGVNAVDAKTQVEVDGLLAKGYRAGEATTSANVVAGVTDAQIPAAIARDSEVTTATTPLSGTTALRPAGNTVPAGRSYFNTTTGKPNYSNGVSWVDAAGVAA